MIEKVKNLLLIATMCSFVIENLPMISMGVGISYIIVSVVDSINYRALYCNPLHRSLSITWFILFAYVTLLTALVPYNRSDLPIVDIRWLRAIILFVLVYKDTLYNSDLQKTIFYMFAISSIICAVMMSRGIGISVDAEQYDIGHVRLTFFGTNSNKMAMFYTYAIAASLLYIEEGWIWHISKKIRYIIAGIMIVLLCYGTALTGSRGAFYVIVAMMTYYVALYQKSGSWATKLITTIIAAVFAYYLIDVMTNVDVFARRMEMTTEGQHGERDVLLSAALNVFEENPFGVGLNRVYDYMQMYMGDSKTPHNLFAYMIASGGFIGFSLFVSIIWKIVKYAFINARANRLLMPILLLIIVLLDFNKNGGALSFSMNYCALALALSMSNNKTV